jgi:hypothetical protein
MNQAKDGIIFWGGALDYSTTIATDSEDFAQQVMHSLLVVKPGCVVTIYHRMGHYLMVKRSCLAGFHCSGCNAPVRQRKISKGRTLYSCLCLAAMTGRDTPPYGESEWNKDRLEAGSKDVLLRALFLAGSQNN